MQIVVTGASGFLGTEVADVLASRPNFTVVAASRSRPDFSNSKGDTLIQRADFPELSHTADEKRFDAVVDGANCVVHLAALTPASGKAASADEFTKANVIAAQQFARACARKGVGKFIFLSSLGVCGATTTASPLSEDSATAPYDDYTRSKLDAETAILAVARETGIATTIIRAPMIYGPGAGGPVTLLARAVMKGVPLPFKLATRNQRDMIGVRNAAEFIAACVEKPAAAGELFVVRDGTSVSTRQLIESIAEAAQQNARLIPAPIGGLTAFANLLGRGQLMRRLVGDYRVDDAKARRLLGWSAPQPIAFDMSRLVNHLRG